MRLDLFVLADEVETDESGKLTITGAGVSHVRGPELPVRVAKLAAVARLIAEPGDFGTDVRLRTRWVEPDGTIFDRRSDSIIPAERVRPPEDDKERAFFFVFSFGELQFDQRGPHRLQLLVNDEVLGERVLEVLQEALGSRG